MQIIRYRMKRQQGPTGWHRELLQGGEPLWGPEACLKLRTVLSRGTLMLTGERLPWEGVRRWRTGEKGKPGEPLCHVITVSGFRVMGLVSSLSPASLSDVGSFLVVIHPPTKTGSREDDSGNLLGHMEWPLLSSLDFSWIPPVGGGLLLPYSLPGPPVYSCKCLLWSLAWSGGFSQYESWKNYIQYSVINYNGNEYEKDSVCVCVYVCVCVCVTESLCCTAETNTTCKSTVFQ